MFIQNILYHPVSGKTNTILLITIALIPAFVFFPFPDSVFSNGIDPPLTWVFNFLIQGNSAIGKHIIFPHGPLAFLMYPLPGSPTFWIAVMVHLVLRIFLAYCLLKLATHKHFSIMIFALVTTFVLLALNDILLTIVQIIILCYLNFFERRNVTWLIPALIITPIALYIKAFVGIVSLLVTLSFLGIMIFRSVIGLESRFRLLLFLIIPFVLFLVWLGLYGDFEGMVTFFKGMYELAADNSAAVAVYPSNNWWLIGIALGTGLLLLLLNLKNTTLLTYSILVSPALFALWKYGMAREDYLHTSMMFIFILFIILTYNILTKSFKLFNCFFSVIIVLLFYFTLQNSYYFEPYQVKANGLQNLVSKIIHNSYFADTCQYSSEKSIARNKLDNNILKLIGNQTVDVYPWDYSYLAANNLKWQPRPVIQSYASYSYKLDALNAGHFNSEKAPGFIIWELRKITHDIHGGTLESIDGRYLLNDEPETLLALLCNYELVASQKGIFPALIFKKRSTSLTPAKSQMAHARTKWNEWIDVPQNNSSVIQASVAMARSMAGKIKSFLYKDEAIYVYYLLEKGDIRMYRIVPKNAAYGLWINPLIINPEYKRAEPSVQKIMFRCSNTAMMKPEIDIEWNQVSFIQPHPIYIGQKELINPVYSFFGITDLSTKEYLFCSTDSLESVIPNWAQPDETKIISTGSNRMSQLNPNDYSVSFGYSLDSLHPPDGMHELVVRAGVWAKARTDIQSVLVISIEKNGKSLLWKGVDMNEFLHDKNVMNYVTNYSILDKELLQQKGLILKVYAWNTGKQPLLLDDLSVRIEAK
ncbi:MAG: hypothetical protein WCI92_14055 [Bacteroidota bacterium]